MFTVLYFLCRIIHRQCSASIIEVWHCVSYYVYCVYHISCAFCTVLYEFCILLYRMLCEYVVYRGCKFCIVLALLPAQCAVCVKSCIVSLLLPAHRGVCVSPVLYLHYCQYSVMLKLILYCELALLPEQSAVHLSSVLCLYYSISSAVWCVWCVCVFALLPAQFAVCVYTSCVVFALLPVQFAVC